MAREARVNVIQPEPAIEKNILAQAIVEIGSAARKLMNSGINRDAVIVLIHDRCKVGKPAIREVLNGLRQLENDFCK